MMELRLGKYALTIGKRAAMPRVPAGSPFSSLMSSWRNIYGSTGGDKSAALKAYNGYVQACVQRRAEREAASRYMLLDKRTGEAIAEDKLPIPYGCLRRPNPTMSGNFFWRMVSINLHLCGTSPVLKIRNGAGAPFMLWPLIPSRTTAHHDPTDWIRFEYATEDGRTIKLKSSEVIYFRQPHPTRQLDGQGDLEAAGLFADTDNAIWEYQRQLFQGGPFAQWIVKYPREAGILSPDQASVIADTFADAVSDREQASRPVLMFNGAEVDKFPVTNEGLEVPTINEEIKERIRCAFGVSKTILGEVDGYSRANVEGAEYSLARSIDATLRLLDEEMERSLLPDWDERLTGEWESVIPEDREFLLRQEAQDLATKVRTVNEIRMVRGLEDVEWGETPWGSFGDTQVGGDDEPQRPAPPSAIPPPEDEEDEDEESPDEVEDDSDRKTRAVDPEARRAAQWRAFVALQDPYEKRVLAVLRQLFKRQEAAVIAKLEEKVPRFLDKLAGWSRDHAVSYFEKRSIADDIADVSGYADEFTKALKPYLLALYRDAGKKALQSVGGGTSFVVNQKGIDLIGNHLTKSTDVILQTTADQIKAALTKGFLEGEGVDALASRIRELYDGIDKGRALTIARTETVAPANLGAVEGYKQAGVERKEWITTRDGFERDSHAAADGTIIGIDEDFTVGADRMKFPGGGSLAEENINCRCAVAGVVAEEEN